MRAVGNGAMSNAKRRWCWRRRDQGCFSVWIVVPWSVVELGSVRQRESIFISFSSSFDGWQIGSHTKSGKDDDSATCTTHLLLLYFLCMTQHSTVGYNIYSSFAIFLLQKPCTIVLFAWIAFNLYYPLLGLVPISVGNFWTAFKRLTETLYHLITK